MRTAQKAIVKNNASNNRRHQRYLRSRRRLRVYEVIAAEIRKRWRNDAFFDSVITDSNPATLADGRINRGEMLRMA